MKELHDLRIWIGILFSLLMALNTIFFMIYGGAHTQEPLSTQLWNYLESQTFQGVSASLVAPIIFFFLENRLKILESIKANREKQIELENQELEERQRNLRELVEKYLVQFEEVVSSMWYRNFNILFMGGQYVTKTRTDNYFQNSFLYALACLLAYKRIFVLEGIYAKMAFIFEHAESTGEMEEMQLDEVIREELNGISGLLDEIGSMGSGSFFRYDQLALAEAAMVKDVDHYRISTILEFTRKYQDKGSHEFLLLKPATDSLSSFLLFDLRVPRTDEEVAARAILIEMTKRLGVILRGLHTKAAIKISVGDDKLSIVDKANTGGSSVAEAQKPA